MASLRILRIPVAHGRLQVVLSRPEPTGRRYCSLVVRSNLPRSRREVTPSRQSTAKEADDEPVCTGRFLGANEYALLPRQSFRR